MSTPREGTKVLILDFGSQYTQLIARLCREIGVYCEVQPFSISFAEIQRFQPALMILSGGPESVTQPKSPRLSFPYHEFRKLKHPRSSTGVSVLGICYGMQLMASENGGLVSSGSSGQYGPGVVRWKQSWVGPERTQKVWLSHGDHVAKLPTGFTSIASTESIGTVAMLRDEGNRWDLGLQFHPEVHHTEHGRQLLEKLILERGGCEAQWKPASILKHLQDQIRETLKPTDHVLMGLSGGVDSSVVAWLLADVIGPRLHCVLVDTGLLRLRERESILEDFKDHRFQLDCVNASSAFLGALKGVQSPEEKRKIIGRVFIDTFREWSRSQTQCTYLGQGTLYPDVIESLSVKGPSHTIKTHHNVGGLPPDLPFKLIEPVRNLFKDEVRALGREMGMPSRLIDRHPFPGPGLAVRVIGEVTEEKLRILREVDALFISQLERHQLMGKIWQAFAVLTDTDSVGVRGDARSVGPVVALRAVTSRDGMTADWFMFDEAFLRETSSRILNECQAVSRVVLDISSKPPATIEWE